MHRAPARAPGRRRRPVRAPFAGAAVVVTTLVLGSCGQTSDPAPPSPASAAAPTSAAPSPAVSASAASGTTSCAYPSAGKAAKPAKPPPTTGVPTTGKLAYTLAMTGGPVTITLDRKRAPCTVNSFASLADQGYFAGTSCHRLADSGILVLQCGDPSGTGSGGPGYSFADETRGDESYTTGVVAMANAGPATNGSQFFLVWGDSTGLDKTPNYTIFGRLDAKSRDVVAQMAGEGQDGSNPDGTGKPNNPSEITKVTKD